MPMTAQPPDDGSDMLLSTFPHTHYAERLRRLLGHHAKTAGSMSFLKGRMTPFQTMVALTSGERWYWASLRVVGEDLSLSGAFSLGTRQAHAFNAK